MRRRSLHYHRLAPFIGLFFPFFFALLFSFLGWIGFVPVTTLTMKTAPEVGLLAPT